MCNKGTTRREGVVLVARKDDEYWFISSVFRYNRDHTGCTGMAVIPVSKEQADDAFSIESLEERFGDHWNEYVGKDVRDGCEHCAGEPQEEGCEHCEYQSLREFCADIVQYGGYDAVFDYPGDRAETALNDIGIETVTADTSGCGRIFSRASLDDFDEVYNHKALGACLAYEAGTVSYDFAVRAIFDN